LGSPEIYYFRLIIEVKVEFILGVFEVKRLQEIYPVIIKRQKKSKGIP
jgi:hypothetical protein